jgi:anti-anti-sigma factor
VKIESRHFPTYEYLSIQGRVDGFSARKLKKNLEQAARLDSRKIVVDLSAADFLSNRGMVAILHAQEISRKNGGEVILLGASPQIKASFAHLEFETHLKFTDYLSDALE